MDPPRTTEFAGNVPAAAVGIKWGGNRSRTRQCRVRCADRYAMNMRAADAIVSKAPKAMKIFPISEVLSRVVLSLFAA
jgi:hypothetical protein